MCRRRAVTRATLAGVVALAATLSSPGTSAGAPAQEGTPGNNTAQRFLVVLEDHVDPDVVVRDHGRAHGAKADLVYRAALKGYAATMSPAAAARVAVDPRVAFVEADQVVHAFGEVPTGVDRSANPATNDTGVSHLDIDGMDDRRVDVDVAVIDTGIDDTHPDLYVVGKTDCSGGSPRKQSCADGSGGDGNGHGTHVAGSIAALDNGRGVVGVAPGARLWGVKVLSDSGSGYMSWIVAGIDWVTAKQTIEVANMSLGCECPSAAMDTAIANSVLSGVTYAVAAGNSAKDASTFSPANHPDVITVSALADFDGRSGGAGTSTCRSDQDDTLADFSNHGAVVEIAAPGVCITSTWPGGGYNTISGTSMASPHVAGAAALLASKSRNPGTIRTTLVDKGNTDWFDDSGDGILERLLDVSDPTVFTPAFTGTDNSGGGGGETTNPTISLTATGSKVKGIQQADLSWAGATTGNVDVYRNGAVVTTTPDDGQHTDKIGKGSGTYTYKLCETGSTTACSNEATVVIS